MVADRHDTPSMRQDVAMDAETTDDLLDGLEGEERDARKKLIEYLRDLGFADEQIAAAAREDRLTLLAVERVLGGNYTAAEIEERTGLPAEVLARLRRMLGLPKPNPEDRQFGEEDIAMAKSTQLFLDAGLRDGAI